MRPRLCRPRLAGVGLVAFAVGPLLWALRTSLTPEGSPGWPWGPLTLWHYQKILGRDFFYQYAGNTLAVALGATAVSLPPALAGGYALARYRFWGRGCAPWLLALPLLPVVTFLVPLSRTMNRLGLYDTLLILVLANAALALPFAVWMLRNYVRSVPVEIEEAARLDGCGTAGLIVRVALPCMLPGAAAVGAFVFVQSWNNFVFAYALTTDESLRVLPKAVVNFIGSWRTDWGGLMAVGILTLLPPLALFQLVQRWFVAGLFGWSGK